MATFALLVVPSTLWPKLRSLSYLSGACCLIASTAFPVGFARSYTPIETTTGVVLGIVMAAVSVITNRREPFGIEPIVVLSSMAGQSWFVLSIWAVSKSAWNPLIALAACLGLAILNSLLSSRSSFAPVVITVVFVHLSGCLASGEQLFRPVAPQVVVVILEFCLMGMASYRHAAALLAKYPLSTYRSSPQCLVPDLDHAWDHPVKIDAF